MIWGERGKESEWGRIVSERANGIASRTRIGDGKLNLSIYPSRVTHARANEPTSKVLQAVEQNFDEYDLS